MYGNGTAPGMAAHESRPAQEAVCGARVETVNYRRFTHSPPQEVVGGCAGLYRGLGRFDAHCIEGGYLMQHLYIASDKDGPLINPGSFSSSCQARNLRRFDRSKKGTVDIAPFKRQFNRTFDLQA